MVNHINPSSGFSKAAYEWEMTQPSGLEWEACDPATSDERLIEIVQKASHVTIDKVATNSRLSFEVATAILDGGPEWYTVERLASAKKIDPRILERIFRDRAHKSGGSWSLQKKLVNNPNFPKELLVEFLPNEESLVKGETRAQLAVILHKKTPIEAVMNALPFIGEYNKLRVIKARRVDMNKHLAEKCNLDINSLRTMPVDLLISLF